MLIAYTLPAINRGLQAAGRVIRDESERGVLLFCDRRFGSSGTGGVRQFLPEWVSQELVVADASSGRKIIAAKLAEWKHDMGSGTGLVCDQLSRTKSMAGNRPSSTRATKNNKKENLRELAKKLGAKRIVEKKL